MLLLLIPSVVFVVLLIAYIISENISGYRKPGLGGWLYNHRGIADVLLFIAGGVLAILLFATGMIHLEYADLPATCDAAQQTIDNARIETGVDIDKIYENAAILNKVVELNQKLASAKYWNNNIWTSWMIPDKAADIPYIK